MIIVNYHTESLLGECLKSFYLQANHSKCEIIIVDNNEDQGKVKYIQDVFPDIKLIESRRNVGFSAGCNLGLQDARGEYILLLNPDTRLSFEALSCMLDFMESHPEAGIIGPQLLDEKGSLHALPSCSGIFPSPLQAFFEYTNLRRFFPKYRLVKDYFLTDWDRCSIREVAMVQGACFLIKSKVIAEIGKLDERFFLYWEETDWCLRAHKKGWKIFYIPFAQCVHFGGQSMGRERFHDYHFFRSMYRFHSKHYGIVSSVLLRFVLICAFIFGIAKFSLRSIGNSNTCHQARIEIEKLGNKIIAHLGIQKKIHES